MPLVQHGGNVDLGDSTVKFRNIHATNGALNIWQTEKQQIASLT